MIKFTGEDVMVAAAKGTMKQLRAIKKKKMGNDHGGTSRRGVSKRWINSIFGELGEIIVARELELPITAQYGNLDPSIADVARVIEVKATEVQSGHLPAYDHTPNNFICVLVIIDMSSLTARIAGWLEAPLCRDKAWWRADMDPPCYFVPQSELNPIESIPIPEFAGKYGG